jgi:hypothetical protein
MGIAYYPSFEKKIPGFEPATAVSGKTVARAIEQLDEICKRVGVKPMGSFLSESLEKSFALTGEDVPAGMVE